MSDFEEFQNMARTGQWDFDSVLEELWEAQQRIEELETALTEIYDVFKRDGRFPHATPEIAKVLGIEEPAP